MPRFAGRTLALVLVTLALQTMAVGAQVGQQGEVVQTMPPIDRDALLGAPSGAPRAGDELDQVTEEMAKEMRCPVCQGLSIADSRAESALAMKQEVRELLAEGYSREQVMAYFERSFGEFVRLEPKAEGFNLTVWIAPLLALVLGFGVVVRHLRRGPAITTVAPAESNDDVDVDDDGLKAYREKVRREVAR